VTDYLTSYAGKTILVTGGAGGIGSNLTRALAEQGARVVVLDDLSSAQRWNVPALPNVQFIQGSVLDEQELKRVFSLRPHVVYHLAALFANQNSIDHPQDDLMVNGLGTLLILQYAQLTGVERVVYASSGCSVYGRNAPFPLTEGYLSLDLDTPYMITKMLGELYCNFFRNFHGLKSVRTRFFNSFGPGEIPGAYRNVIPNFIYWAMQGQALPIMGTGEETRDWTYVGDIVDGLLRAGYYEQAIGEEMNLASGREVRVIDMANAVNELTGNPAGIRFIERRKWDHKTRLLASIAKAGQLIGYHPQMDFRAGLEQNVRWFRDNWDRIQASARF
jgi:nucleoside-diphosphate-sugar epimerase